MRFEMTIGDRRFVAEIIYASGGGENSLYIENEFGNVIAEGHSAGEDGTVGAYRAAFAMVAEIVAEEHELMVSGE